MSKVSKFILFTAVLFALITRFWHLGTIPYPPDGDEVAFGYYGWSLLHYGTDEYNKFLPISFTSIGDNKYPGLPYLNIIPAAIFGLSDIETRFLSASSGVLLVITVYFLTKYLFNDEKVSLFSAWAIALSPWAIISSRLGYEVFVPVFLVTTGFTCFLYATSPKIKKHKKTLLITSFILLIYSTFTHAAARFFVPVFLFSLLGVSFLKGSFLKDSRKLILVFLITISSLVALTLLSPTSWGRAKEDVWKGITGEEQNRLQELYIGAGTSIIKLPPRVTWLFHNKYRITLFDLFDRYMEHFSFGYLFTRGEESGQRIPDMGVLLLADLLLLPFGLIALIKNKNSLSSIVLFLWLIISPIPASLTTGVAKMDRSPLLIIPLTIISALGFGHLANLSKKKEKLIIAFLVTIVSASSLYALNQIFVQKPLDRPWTKQEVNEKLTKDILALKDKYDAVATGGDDYIFFLFYGKISPKEFIKMSEIKNDSQWNRVAKLANIYFNMPYKCPKGGKLNVLYVCEGVEVPQNAKVIKSYYYPDGVAAYSLVEFYPASKIPAKGNLPSLPDKFHYMVQLEDKYPDGVIPKSSSSLW